MLWLPSQALNGRNDGVSAVSIWRSARPLPLFEDTLMTCAFGLCFSQRSEGHIAHRPNVCTGVARCYMSLASHGANMGKAKIVILLHAAFNPFVPPKGVV